MVILDEPTVGQDAIQKEKLAEITRTLHSSGKTVIIVSHDVEFLWSLQPRVVVMRQGRVVGDGPCARRDARPGVARAPRGCRSRSSSGSKSTCGRSPPSPSSTSSEARAWIDEGDRSSVYWIADGFLFRRVVSPFHKLDPRVKLTISIEFFVLSLFASYVS